MKNEEGRMRAGQARGETSFFKLRIAVETQNAHPETRNSNKEQPMKHYFRYRYALAALLNFGLKLQLLSRRHERRNLSAFKVIGEKVSA